MASFQWSTFFFHSNSTHAVHVLGIVGGNFQMNWKWMRFQSKDSSKKNIMARFFFQFIIFYENMMKFILFGAFFVLLEQHDCHTCEMNRRDTISLSGNTLRQNQHGGFTVMTITILCYNWAFKWTTLFFRLKANKVT